VRPWPPRYLIKVEGRQLEEIDQMNPMAGRVREQFGYVILLGNSRTEAANCLTTFRQSSRDRFSTLLAHLVRLYSRKPSTRRSGLTGAKSVAGILFPVSHGGNSKHLGVRFPSVSRTLFFA
jgi:hypothetical protein